MDLCAIVECWLAFGRRYDGYYGGGGRCADRITEASQYPGLFLLSYFQRPHGKITGRGDIGSRLRGSVVSIFS